MKGREARRGEGGRDIGEEGIGDPIRCPTCQVRNTHSLTTPSAPSPFPLHAILPYPLLEAVEGGDRASGSNGERVDRPTLQGGTVLVAGTRELGGLLATLTEGRKEGRGGERDTRVSLLRSSRVHALQVEAVCQGRP